MKKIILIVVLLLVGAAIWWASTGYFSKGERAGTISKLSEKGYIFKTNEGQLNEGGFSGETGSMAMRIWDFSAKDEKVVEKLKMALSTGERVTLEYQEKFFQFSWNGDTKYFITDVKFLPKPETAPAVLTPPPPPPPVDSASITK